MGLVSIAFSLFRETQTKKKKQLQQIADASTMNTLGHLQSKINRYVHALEKTVDDKEREKVLLKVNNTILKFMLGLEPIITYGYDVNIPKEFVPIFEHIATISEYTFIKLFEDDETPFVSYSICINEKALKKREEER